MNVDQYRKDAVALHADSHPSEGLRHAERVLSIAEQLMKEYACDQGMVSAACILHGVTTPAAVGGDATSEAIAQAYLKGAGASEDFIQGVRNCIRATIWSGTGEEGHPASNEAQLVWHADRLDLLSVERHVDFLAGAPVLP